MLRSFLFFISVFSGIFILIFPLTTLQATPQENNAPQAEQKTTPPDQATAENYATMTQHQLNQIKRYDCRLPNQIISHDYSKESSKKNSIAPSKETKK
jgi:hypothetical protein